MAKAKSTSNDEKAPRSIAGRPTIALNSKTGSVNQLRLQVVGLPKGNLSVTLEGVLASSWSVASLNPPRCPGPTAFDLVIILRGELAKEAKREREPRATNDLTVTITSTPTNPPGPPVTTPEVDVPIHVFHETV